MEGGGRWEWGFKFQMHLQPERCWALRELSLPHPYHDLTYKGEETYPVGSQGGKWFFLPLPSISALWSYTWCLYAPQKGVRPPSSPAPLLITGALAFRLTLTRPGSFSELGEAQNQQTQGGREMSESSPGTELSLELVASYRDTLGSLCSAVGKFIAVGVAP